MKHFFLLFFVTIFFTQCSSLQSGQYIQLWPQDSLESLSKEFNIPSAKIMQANKGAKFETGEWIFIPLKRGVVANIRDERTQENSGGPEGLWDSKLQWPLPSSYKITSDFGWRQTRNHKGIDIKGQLGDSIVAADDGVVIYSGNKLRGYGNLTILYHGSDLYTVYAHAQKNFTKKGEKVHRGQIIATVGNTGKATGTHLHFEVRQGHLAISPLEYFRF